MQKAICRDPANKFGTFVGQHDFCYASYTLSDYRKANTKGLSNAQEASVQMSVGIRPGRAPDLTAGLDLTEHEFDLVEDQVD